MSCHEFEGLCILGLVTWWLCGMTGAIYEWHRHSDVNIGDLVFFGVTVAFLGPIMWIVVWADGKRFGAGHVVFKKKEK